MLLLQHAAYSPYLFYKDWFLLSRNFHVRTLANFYTRWARFTFFFYAWPSIYCLYFVYARIKRQWKSTCNTFLCILGFLFKVSFSSRFTLFTAVDLVYYPPQNVALPLSAVIPRRSWNLKLYDLQQEIVHKSAPERQMSKNFCQWL